MNRGADGATWLRTPGNISIANDAGDVILFERATVGVYEFHWLQMKTKGREAVRITLDAIDEVFREKDCAMMFGLVPVDRRDSKLMARWIGSKSVGIVPTEHGPCEMFIMTREMRYGFS